MNVLGKKKIVILGMMTKIPVAGNIWVVAHYLVGLRRLGYEPYYVEAHARTPSMLMESDEDDSSAKAAAFLDRVMRRFDLAENWAFHALHDDGRCYGLSETQLRELYQSAELIVNLHAGTVPLPEHYATDRMVCLETDPVELEIGLYHQDAETVEFLRPHRAFFTWGLNYDHPDCRLPRDERFVFRPSPPPVICDWWRNGSACGGEALTTIGNWRQEWRDMTFKGEVYHWSKHFEYLKFLDLPRRTAQPFELALSSYTEQDKRMLEERGWKVRHAMAFSAELDPYREYIQNSRGEFTVAKDQNIRLRSGWFSERSVQYLAAGRPVITQDTGFGNFLPTGRGLFGFSTMEEVLAAVDAINSDYEGHCRAAAEIAREYFNYDVVLKKLLDQAGVASP
jgi:hypothetical protein